MALTPGTKLSHFEILAQIGAGGMGEVYRATDTTLKRDVAIKLLPATLQPMSPPTIDRVVKDCLAKDPDDRYQTARDLHRELLRIKQGEGQESVRPRCIG